MSPWLILALVGAYFVGMFPTAKLVGRRIGRDPTQEGSRNPGATNMYRIGGRLVGLIVVAGDMSKGALPTLVALLLWGRPEALAAWFGVVAGHVWPIHRPTGGGKGVASAGGGAIVLDPLAGVICAGIFVATVSLSRMAAVGSLTIAVAYPVAAALLGWPLGELLAALAVMCVMTLRHHTNIVRLWRGKESKLWA